MRWFLEVLKFLGRIVWRFFALLKRGMKQTRKHHVVTIVALGFLVLGVLVLWAASLRLPDLQSFEERIVQQSTKIYDRTGEILLFAVHENVQRTIISRDQISRHIKNATVAIEDTEFYEHQGVRIKAIFRALLINLSQGNPVGGQGGSTITQQVVKNSLLTPEKLLSRKLKEWVLALKLEQVLSKDEILEIYLNETPYGGNLYGVEEASKSFFGKSANEVSLAEAAYLAALPQAPTYYSPHGDHRDDLEARKTLVLTRMLDQEFITEQEFIDASKEEVAFLERQDVNIKAPHFVFHVQEYVEQKYGRRAIEEDGLKITTTLNYELQKAAEEIVLRNATSNEERFNAENAALVAIEPETGHILTMVGSRDYFDENIDGKFNVATAHRQPGSAFKPFVYATAFEKGYTPDTIVFDLATEFSTTCNAQGVPKFDGAECYKPGNYDGVFRGPMTLRDALAQSVNVPAVKALYLAGLKDSLRTAKNMGIASLTNVAQYGLTLVLGGGEVTPLEMAGAYAVFANEGVRNEPTAILSIETNSGKLLEEFEATPKKVLDKNIALTISDVLSDNVARTPAFGANSYLHFGAQDVAAKTGTTNDYRDAWIVGYTPSISVATWAGNNDNTSMEKKVAGFIVAPMWNEFMQVALEQEEHPPFPRAAGTSTPTDVKPVLRGVWQGGESVAIDSISGKLATQYTPQETIEEIVVPDVHSILYWVNKDNPLGPKPAAPELDPQFAAWEYAVNLWSTLTGTGTQVVEIPDEKDDVHTRDTQPEIDLEGIERNENYDEDDTINVRVETESTYPIDVVEVFLNGRYLGKDESAPYEFSLDLEELTMVEEENTLKVVATDSVFNKDQQSIRFYVR